MREAPEGILSELDAFYPAPVHDWGNDAQTRFGSSKDNYAAWEVEFYSELLRRGFRPNLLPARTKIPCMVFHRGAELYDAEGEIYNCTEVSYVPTYEREEQTVSLTVGGAPATRIRNSYAIGHLDGEERPERRRLLDDFYDRVEREEYPCGDCAMLPVCGGACPKLWREGTAACPSNKFNIEQKLMLDLAAQRLEKAGA